MSNRQVSTSFQKIKLFGGVFLVILLVIAAFVFFEGRDSAQASQGLAGVLAENATPTPFLPSSDADAFLFDTFGQAVASPTPRPSGGAGNGLYPTVAPEAMPTLSDITPYSLPTGFNPLTGLPPASPEFLDRRPVASKVTLFPRSARPQYGLTLADVVYEYYIEWGATRFIAVYYGENPPQIGPVRSGRFFDEHIARMYQSYLVFKYADKRVLDYFEQSDIRDFLIVPLVRCSPFFIGQEDRNLYNNVFFDMTSLGPCLERHGYDNNAPNLRSGYFSERAPVSDEEGLHIFGIYSLDDYHHWRYEPGIARYYREQETDDLRNDKTPTYAPLMDNLTGEQVSADNLVYVFFPHTFADQWQEEDEVYHIEPLGTGDAYLFRNGRVIPAYWRRFVIDQPLELTDLNGEPLALKPGRTFYEVMRQESVVTHDGVNWYFQFEP